ncbi:MAG TPA: hypothetical protein VMF32_23030 [Xanthobacteraceae bacterium]|nr:hypothetical protein [Xanthobacteraceae bacterium]
MKIDCLMGTYGRYSQVCDGLACFLQQTALEDATMLIYNQHPVPLTFDHPRVRVINETRPTRPLRYIRQRMFDLADPAADLIHLWDDDDLYLPWHLQDCLEHIGDAAAWKPARSWYSHSTSEFNLIHEIFEGSWIFRANHVARASLDTHPTAIDHPIYAQTIEAGLVAVTDLGGRASYIYRWHLEWTHYAAFGGSHLQALQQQNMARLQERNRDVHADGRLVPSDLRLRWQQFLDGTRQKISANDWEHNRGILSAATAGRL